MRKLLLVVFVGLVLAINLYGIAHYIDELEDEPATVVYME